MSGIIAWRCETATSGTRANVARPMGTGAACEEMYRCVYSLYGSPVDLRELDDQGRLRRELFGTDVTLFLAAEAEGRA